MRNIIRYSLDEINLLVDKIIELTKDCNLFLFEGDLGSGKTTLIKNTLKKIGITENVKSPTFSIINKYAEKNIVVFHIDLYRIENEEELNSIGIFEYIESDKLCFVEWPQVLTKHINEKAIRVKINILDEFNREVEITNN